MIHAFHIENGKISYRNRWAQKSGILKGRQDAMFNPFDPRTRSMVSGVVTDGLANTNIVWHAGRLLALEEGHAPFELDLHTLESRAVTPMEASLKAR